MSVLNAVECEGGVRIVPGELVLGADDAATMRRSVVGHVGGLATLTVRGLNGKERTITWKRSAGPPSHAVTSRTLPNGSRYVKVDSFSGSGPFDRGNSSAIKRHLQAPTDARGLVLDLRGNPGGGRSAMDTAALFFDDKRTFAAFLCRDRNRAGSDGTEALAGIRRVRPELSLVPWVSIGRILTFLEVMRGNRSFAIELTGDGTFADTDVVVLIDEGTRSAAEMLASFLREQCGATLIGRHSGGECAMPASVRLPATDWSAHIASCRVITGTGVPIEGRGLAPDIPVTHRREDLAIGRDADIEHAIDHLHSLRSGHTD